LQQLRVVLDGRGARHPAWHLLQVCLLHFLSLDGGHVLWLAVTCCMHLGCEQL
jgi:hypothetical protein